MMFVVVFCGVKDGGGGGVGNRVGSGHGDWGECMGGFGGESIGCTQEA